MAVIQSIYKRILAQADACANKGVNPWFLSNVYKQVGVVYQQPVENMDFL